MTRCTTFCRTLGFALMLAFLACALPVSAMTVNTLVDEQDGSVTDGDVSLRDALALAPAGDTITFSVRGKIVLTRGQLSIRKPITISGPGRSLLVIDGGKSGRIALVSDNNAATSLNVAIRGVKLQNGVTSGDGGALLSLENLIFSNGEISNCTCGGAGGGICSGGARVGVISSSIFNCTAAFGGGAIFVAKDRACELTHLFARYNRAQQGGVVYASVGTTLTTYRGTLATNFATNSEGGGIYSAGAVDIRETQFLDNEAQTPNLAVKGSGGAIFLRGGPSAIITSALFQGNVAADGAAIWTDYAATRLVSCNFTANRAARGAAVLLAGPSLVLTNCWMTSNETRLGATVTIKPLLATNVVITIAGGAFRDNISSNFGGVIGYPYPDGTQSLVGVLSCTIDSGAQFIGNLGGGSPIEADILIARGALFQNNQGHVTAGAGSELTDCRFTGNRVGNGAGGALYLFTTSSASSAGVKLTRCVFTGNDVTGGSGSGDLGGSGGALFVGTGIDVSLQSSTVTGNGSPEDEGRDVFNYGTLRIDSTSTVGNIAGPGTVIRN